MRVRWTYIAAVSAALAAAPIGITWPVGLSQALAKNDGGNGDGRNGNHGHSGKNGRDDGPGRSDDNKANKHDRSGRDADKAAEKAAKSAAKANRNDDKRGSIARMDDARDRDRTNRPDLRDRARAAELRSDDRERAAARSRAANELGSLNAAHASANARSRASSNSMVGRIGTYETNMHNALAIQDPATRANAISAARERLAQSSNKPLTPSAITRVDGLLGIKGAPPDLGATR